MTYNAISFAAPAEIIASKLKFTLAFKKHLESRTEKCAYYWDKQGHDAIVLIEKDYDAFIKALGIAFSSQFKELRGVSVSRGKIVGTVKIINIPAVRNRRVEAFFNADYGARFMYAEIAGRANFNQDWIMEVSVPEMFGALEGKPLPNETEMKRRFVNYAMLVRNSETTLITDPDEIKKLEREYFVDVAKAEEIRGKMACLGGIIRGKAKICLDKSEISKVERGDILVAQFTTPDFVQAMEKAAAVVADQGGLSSHAAIVSRELGVPCVIATMNGTRIIHDNDLLEIDAQKGVVKIVERA
ncbi:MAG: hypothetical protein HZC26_03960 [Candidatus Magasanikbacteria bacterium]|nr:hypothetical protein [Candidatus Magasanikbacteria bacterium]